MGKGRRWDATVFGGEEGEEVRRLHGAGGGQQNKEQHNGWRLQVEDDQRKLGRWAKCAVGLNC
jgi:hypothetical protein